MSKSFTYTVASSVVSIDPFAGNQCRGIRDTVIVFNSSGDKSALLIMCIDAPEWTINPLLQD